LTALQVYKGREVSWFDQVAEKAFEHGTDRVVIVDDWSGGPGKIELFVFHLMPLGGSNNFYAASLKRGDWTENNCAVSSRSESDER
jgi:hypothetical protein